MVNRLDSFERQVVFVIDDHPIVSFGLLEMVKDVAPHARIRQFSTLKDAVRHAVGEFPAMVISDFHLKDVQAESFIGLFETLFPGIPVLITANDEKVMGQLRHYKFDRYIAFSKFTPFPKLIDLIRIGLAQANIDLLEIPKLSRALTQKQIEVLELIGAGHSNKEIANFMGISVETVKGHVKDILERLNAKNRMEASIIYRHAQIQQNPLPEPSLHNI